VEKSPAHYPHHIRLNSLRFHPPPPPSREIFLFTLILLSITKSWCPIDSQYGFVDIDQREIAWNTTERGMCHASSFPTIYWTSFRCLSIEGNLCLMNHQNIVFASAGWFVPCCRLTLSGNSYKTLHSLSSSLSSSHIRLTICLVYKSVDNNEFTVFLSNKYLYLFKKNLNTNSN
jgi:hypothetical protein